MKILFVQRVKAYAGSERYFTTLVPELIRRGIHCQLLFVIHPKDADKLTVMFDTIRQLQIPCEVIYSKRKFSLKLLRRLNGFAKRETYDLIHVHLIQAEFWFSVIRRWLNKSLRLVSTIHGFDEKFQQLHGFDPSKVGNSLYVRLLRFNQPQIIRHAAVSNSLKNLMSRAGIIPEEKISVIYYGANYEAIPRSEKRSSKRIVLVPGRVIPYKGQDLFIQAIPSILKSFPEVQFHFAGECQGKFRIELEKMIQDFGIEKNVNFLGHVNDMNSLYAISEMVVLPARSEGFGLVMTEAFNAGIPVVAFDVSAFNEVIEDGLTGILCPAYDTDQLAAAVVRLLKDEMLRKSIAANARQKLLRDFSLDRMASETIQFYETAISARRLG